MTTAVAPIFNRRQQMTLDTLNVPVILTRLGQFSCLRFSQLKAMVQAARPFAGYTPMSSSEAKWLVEETEAVYNHIVALYDAQQQAAAETDAEELAAYSREVKEAIAAIPYRANK